MTRLLHDRYLPHDGRRVWDLATGDLIALEDAEPGLATHPPNSALVEVLEHGRDGAPRVVQAHACGDGATMLSLQRAAAEGRARGFIPMSVEMYLRLAGVLADALKDRTLMLIAGARTPVALARQALIDAAARAPRPHVLMTFTRPDARTPRSLSSGFFVREAPAVYQLSSQTAATRPRDHSPDVMQLLTKAGRSADFIRSGCHAAAERLLRDVAGALMRRHAFEPAVRMLISLGRLLLERGRARDADDTFAAGAEAARNGRLDELELDARLWQAIARTDAGRLTGAESLCRAVVLTAPLAGGRKLWADAALARVLLWQQRDEEAGTLELSCQSAGDLDEVTAASAVAMGVRLLVQQERLFDAGQYARELLARTATSSDPIVRTIASMAQLRVLCAAGDLTLVEQCLRELAGHARSARAPLRVARARLLLVDTLRRAGRDRDAAAEMNRLMRVRRVAPPLLRMAIDRRLRANVAARARPAPSPSVGNRAVALIRIANDGERDEQALRGVLKYVADSLGTSRVDMVVADAGPVSTVLSVGDGAPTRLGQRALEAGIAIGPEPGDVGREVAVPVRAGQRLIAAVVARWAMDTTPPTHAAELIDLTAAIAAPRVEAMLASARETASAAVAVPDLVGASASMTEVRKAIARAASAPFAVLIEGESGVGKELVARAIHQLSPRRERRFCDVNCAALPEELLESELFGHVRGAFTGAVADRAGLFEDANGGTVFLDEVADLSLRAQAKLLRVLQQHEVRRVGEAFSRKIDVRIVSAANREMRVEAAEGRFRHDLLYRLDVIRIRIPPLRERPEDVPLLAAHFWASAASRVETTATLTHAVMAALSRYHWPGNVRELQNVMSALAVAAPARGQVRPGLLPGVITGTTAVSSARLADARTEFERRFIEVALARAGGSRARAARELGLSRQGLLKVMNRVGLHQTSSIS